MKDRTIILSQIMDGKVQKQFDKALQDVLRNMKDEEVPHKPKRKIVISFEFSADEDRMELNVEAEVKTKLVPQNTLASRYWIEQHYDDVTVEELAPTAIRGQLQIDKETGEIYE